MNWRPAIDADGNPVPATGPIESSPFQTSGQDVNLLTHVYLAFPDQYTASDGIVWERGQAYVTNGTLSITRGPNSGVAFQGPASDFDLLDADQQLLSEANWAGSTLNGDIRISRPYIRPGDYRLSLWFAQYNNPPIANRVFSVSAQGGQLTANVDVSNTNAAVLVTGPVTVIDGGNGQGVLDVNIVALADNSTICCLRLEPLSASGVWRLPITVTTEKLPASDSENSILFVDVTDDSLRSVENGGSVQSDGFDITVTDASGAALPFYRTHWGAVTGNFKAFFRPGRVVATLPAEFFLYFGISGVTNDPSDPVSVYQHYAAALDTSTPNPQDLTGNGHDGSTTTPNDFTIVDSPIGKALEPEFNLNARILLANSDTFKGANRALTFTYLYRRTANTPYGPIAGFDSDNRLHHSNDPAGTLRFDVGGFTVNTTVVPVLNDWYWVQQSVTWEGADATLVQIMDAIGSPPVPRKAVANHPGAVWYTGPNAFELMNVPTQATPLRVDIGEFRIRLDESYGDADWQLESTNYVDPVAFFTVGTPENLGTPTGSETVSQALGNPPNTPLNSQSSELLTAVGKAPGEAFDSVLVAQSI